MANKLNIAGFKDKDSRLPEYRELYEEHPFIEAYSMHTDKRIEKDGPELAIGAKRDGFQDWEIHGSAQLAFLRSRGLKPWHTLVDLGCGTGRLAEQAVPYLDAGRYWGMDISRNAIKWAMKNACDAGLLPKNPQFIHSDGTFGAVAHLPINMIWAHSVITHLPMESVLQLFADLSKMRFGEFCFTFKSAPEPQRSGLKQFQYSPQSLMNAASTYDLASEQLNVDWPAGQKTMRVYR